MDANEAISRARSELLSTFDVEGITNVGLEEVRFDESTDNWLITIGFTRPWDRAGIAPAFAIPIRTYKVVELSNRDGRLLSIQNREPKAA